jgi:hypothetical protein
MTNPWKNNSAARKAAVALGFRSGFERETFDYLNARGVLVEYENREIKFTPPAKTKTYHPDFTLPNLILIETKGRFTTADRQKHKALREQFPHLDIRIVFSNPHTTIAKGSKTTYAMWCDGLGILWAHRVVPEEWINEPSTPERQAAFDAHTTATKPKKKGKLE